MMKNSIKNKLVDEVLSDQLSKEEVKNLYFKELHDFERENNIDPYNEGYTCTEVITEVEGETPLGIQLLSSFIKVAIKVENGWEDLENFSNDPPW